MHSVFILSRNWYDDHEINAIQERVFTEYDLALEYVKSTYTTHGELQVCWWTVQEMFLNEGQCESDELKCYAYVVLDFAGNEQSTRPDPHGNYRPKDHRDSCSTCYFEDILEPAMEFVGINPNELSTDIEDMFTITGKRAPNGHQVSIDMATKFVYVRDDGKGGYTASCTPGGIIVSKYVDA